jgi:4-hydroxy-3-polyprenylbenzoate decarboxylase
MTTENVAELLSEFQDRGELLRIAAEVQPDLEIAEITDRVCRSMAPSPALLFERVAGSPLPIVTNLLGSEWRISRALGVGSLDEAASRAQALCQPDRPDGWLDKLKQVAQGNVWTQFEPQTIRNAPCQQVVRLGSDIRLTDLPFLRSWPRERRAGWTNTLIQARLVEGGGLASRLDVVVRDDRSLLVPLHSQDRLLALWRQHRRAGTRLELAIVLGGAPPSLVAQGALLPADWHPLLAAGLWRGQPLQQVKCRTLDLEVPAQAEVVLEGHIEPTEDPEAVGPLAGSTGCYRMWGAGPVVHLTAVTQRANPVVPHCVFGRFSHEEYWLNQTAVRLGLPLLRKLVPEVVDCGVPRSAARQNTLFVSIRKTRPGQARQVLSSLWGLAPQLLTRLVVVVDAGVNVHDADAVWRAVGIHCLPGRDTVVYEGPAHDPDPQPMPFRMAEGLGDDRELGARGMFAPEMGRALGFDATRKELGEVAGGGTPEELVMSPEVQDLVTRRWGDYGLSSNSRPGW